MHTNSRIDVALTTAAAAGIGFFVVVVALLPLAQVGSYNIVRQAISEMAIGNAGWLLNMAFCVMGAGTVCLAVALRRSTGTARVAPILLCVAGALDVVSGTFHAVRYDQPMTTAAGIHMAAGIATFVLTIISMFSMVQPFSRHAQWARFARPTLVWACISAAAFIFLGPGLLGMSHFGLTQRAMALTFMSWLLVTTVLAHRIAAAQTLTSSNASPRPQAEPAA